MDYLLVCDLTNCLSPVALPCLSIGLRCPTIDGDRAVLDWDFFDWAFFD
jgi:hypothetical protein